MTSSQPRQNFAAEVEAAINKQINLELYASYCYLSMAYYFDRDDVALPGFHKFFTKQSDEERGHAQKFMKYQNQRGGRIVLQNVNKPSLDDWGSGIDAMQAALHLEKTVNQSLLDLHKLAATHNDAQVGLTTHSGHGIWSVRELGLRDEATYYLNCKGRQISDLFSILS